MSLGEVSGLSIHYFGRQ